MSHEMDECVNRLHTTWAPLPTYVIRMYLHKIYIVYVESFCTLRPSLRKKNTYVPEDL
jgi:hypothetical protein